MTTVTPYDRAVAAIDVEHGGDPTRITVDGVELPRSLAGGRLAVEWATRFAIFPSEPLLLAARAHHLAEWRIPRGEYPGGPQGDQRWRNDRDRIQRRRLGKLLAAAGYGDRSIDRVSQLVGQRRRPADTEARHLEDAVSIAGLQVHVPSKRNSLGALQLATDVVGVLSSDAVNDLVDAAPVPSELLEQALVAVNRPARPRDLHDRADSLIRRTLGVATNPVVTTSLQLGGLVLIHLLRRHVPDIPVVFVDTGYHFDETIAFRDHVADLWGLNLVVAHPDESRPDYERERGLVWSVDPVQCCAVRKVAPADNSLDGHDAWFTAIRRDQSSTRSAVAPVGPHRLSTGGLITKVHPLAGWQWRDLELYALVNDIPHHPLYEQGYTSIGCAPCTQPTGGSGDDRSGRWNGTMVECGLHIDRSRLA